MCGFDDVHLFDCDVGLVVVVDAVLGCCICGCGDVGVFGDDECVFAVVFE